ncbi:HEAT repeat domain-containing protein [Pedobacter sp. WC2501]|uniref:HEAT repeat domain-containing protein n=1 Tax=Pedobacter sp. WC2501 TaxID=3461400 RepID=UPI00404574FE
MSNSTTFITIIEIIIASSILGILIVYSAIIVRRIGNMHDQRKKLNLDQLIIEKILPQFIDEHSQSVVDIPALDPSVLEELSLMDKKNRQLLIDTLIRLRWHVAGTNALILQKIYIMLNLNQDSLQKIQSSRWFVNVQGLHELTLMDYAISDIDILRFNLSEVSELRSAARSAFMRFSKNEPFRFFDEVRDPLSVWDLIGFFRILDQSNDNAKSSFANWIRYSRNKTVVICCMKLAAHERSVEAIDSIEGLLNVNDHTLRSHAINALGHLQALHTQDHLIKIYANQPVECQREIIFALGAFRTPVAIEFLKEQFMTTRVFEIENHAAEILARLMQKGLISWSVQNLQHDKEHILQYYLKQY